MLIWRGGSNAAGCELRTEAGELRTIAGLKWIGRPALLQELDEVEKISC